MAIGNWGADIVFRVSDRQVFTFNSLNRTVGSEWVTHSRIGQKDQVEYLRPTLQKMTFTITLDATLGVRPRATIDKMADYAERGTVRAMVIGGKRLGRHKWRITDISEAWDTILNKGELVRATLSVTMQEYL